MKFNKRFALLAIVALLSGCGGGGGSNVAPIVAAPAAPAAADPTGPTLTQSADWVTFGHDMQRTGLQPAAGGVTATNVGHLQPIWTYTSAAKFDTAGPIVAGSTVYAADAAGNVVAMNAATGAVLWHRALNAEVKMTPALFDGRLYVATEVDTTPTSQSTFYALNPASGSVLWQRSINGGVHGSPVAIAGRVYVPVAIGDPGYCHPGGVYVFNEQTGVPGFEWQTEPNADPDGGAIWSSVTYDGNRLLFGTGNTCRNASPNANAYVSISTLATLNYARQTAGPLTDDDVGGSVFEQNGVAYVNAKNGKTYAYDPESGTVRWEENLGASDGSGGFSTPTIAASTLVVSGGFPADPYVKNPSITNYGMLYGLDPATGARRWKVSATAPFWAPAAATSDLAFVTIDANVAALNPATGATTWSEPLYGASRAQPAVAGGAVYAVDLSGRLYAFALPTTTNADLRVRTAETRRALPRYHVVPFVNLIPAYCRRV